MYSLYKKTVNNNSLSYVFQKEKCFFGCKSGIVQELLRKVIPKGQQEPYKWHLDFSEELDKNDQAFIINLKPNNAQANLSLYEVADVWGYSSSGWTPIMLRLRALYVDAAPDKIFGKNVPLEDIPKMPFSVLKSEIQDPILSFLYINGSIKDGQLTGKWTAPRSSPTNSALLWPGTAKYFMGIAQSLGIS